MTATASGTSNSLGWKQSASQAVQIDLPTYEKANITFSVDMSNAGLSSGDKVHLNGSSELGGWCGDCNEMTDANSDGIYEMTKELTTNQSYEYKFTINGWSAHFSQNFEILNNLNSFKIFDLPILVGLSRKSFIKKKYGVDNSLKGTLELNKMAIKNGAGGL